MNYTPSFFNCSCPNPNIVFVIDADGDGVGGCLACHDEIVIKKEKLNWRSTHTVYLGIAQRWDAHVRGKRIIENPWKFILHLLR